MRDVGLRGLPALRADYTSLDGLERAVLEFLGRAVSRLSPPVSLANVALSLDIDPNPHLRPDLAPVATIHFDRVAGVFRIELRESEAKSPAPVIRGELSPFGPDLGLRHRGRFAYAHEIVHRLFFVDGGNGTWSRALDQLSRAEESRVVLERWEERICNRGARRLLIPPPLLCERLKEYGCQLPAGNAGDQLRDLVQKVTADFRVSREAALFAIGESDIGFPPDFLAIMLRLADGTAGDRRITIPAGISPSTRLKQELYLRKVPAALGRRFDALCRAMFNDVRADAAPRDLRVPISLGRRPADTCVLTGRFAPLVPGGRAREGHADSILVWGRVGS